jgi:hypothetical protein
MIHYATRSYIMKTKEVIDALFRDKNKMPLFLLNAVSIPFEAKNRSRYRAIYPIIAYLSESYPIPLLRFYEI